MDFNWSLFDGALGVVLLIVIVWVGLKLMARLVIGLIAVAVIAMVFFGVHLSDFGIG